ncbi:MAG: phosphatase PAP2 family protein [Burkholderiaceae bacterium]|nr:phosphatase PAP2 family protein [Burkholderiaceae bacterium]
MRAARLSAPVVAAAAIAVFAALALDVALGGPVSAIDRVVSEWFRGDQGSAAMRALALVSAIHSPRAIAGATVVLVALLLWRRDARAVALVLAAVPCGAALNWLLKQSFGRPRPDAGEGGFGPADFAFPSGHAANSTLLYGSLVLLVLRRLEGSAARAGVAAVACAMVALVGVSRVALRAHYPSDVLAAIAEGVAWLALCASALRPTAERR